MAVTYPRAFIPELLVSRQRLTINRVQVAGQTRGGAVQASERGRSLWQLEVTTTPTTLAEFRKVEAWLDSLRGMLNTFVYFSPIAARPAAYPGSGWSGFTRHGGGAFDGTANVIAASGYSVGLSNLPSTFVVTPGDMISWPWRSSRTLHRVVEGGTAVNGAITVQVEPDVPAGGTLPQTVKLENADAVFRLSEMPMPEAQDVVGSPISLKAIQALF